MPAYATIEDKNSALRRKALNGSMFVAPYSADPIAALTTGAGSLLTALPTGYVDAGLMTDDGEQFSRSVDRSESTSWGRVQPTRSDITSDVTTLQVTLQETNITTIGLYTGVSQAAITPTAVTGEIRIEKPETLADRFYRVLCLAVDTTDDGEFYVARFFPRMKVTDYADQAYGKSDDGITWGITLTAYVDDTEGYSEAQLLGGPGLHAALVDMGYPAAAAS